MLKIELNERFLSALLALGALGILLHMQILEFEQIENLLYGALGVLVGRQASGPGRLRGQGA